MSLQARMDAYAQELVADLVQRGLIVTARKTSNLFTVTIQWPGPNGRDQQSFTADAPSLIDSLKLADQHAAKLLPVKYTEPE